MKPDKKIQQVIEKLTDRKVEIFKEISYIDMQLNELYELARVNNSRKKPRQTAGRKVAAYTIK